MWDATAYLKEARDAHGRWISGAGAIGSVIDDLEKKGDISADEAKTVASAIARHGDMGRGLPKDAEHDSEKTLEYLSASLRHDALTYRHQNPPDKSEAKSLDATANVVEKAKAKYGSTNPEKTQSDSPYRLTPGAQPLDGPSGPMRVKGFVKETVGRLKKGDVVRVTTKGGNVIQRTVERAAPQNKEPDSKIVVRWKDPVTGEKNSTSFDNTVKLSVTAYDGSHLDKPGEPKVVSTPILKTSAAEPKVVHKSVIGDKGPADGSGLNKPPVLKTDKFDSSAISNQEAKGGIADAASALDKVLNVSKQSNIVNMIDSDFATARSLPSGDIAIHQDSARATIQSSVIHEYAHLLDRSVLGSENDWFTQHADEIAKLNQLFNATQSVQDVKNDKVSVLKGDDKMKTQLLQGRELFARAFEQYIAVKSNDPALMKRLDGIRNDDYLKFQHWSDSEFAPISAELDKIFADKGILNGNVSSHIPPVAHPDKTVKNADAPPIVNVNASTPKQTFIDNYVKMHGHEPSDAELAKLDKAVKPNVSSPPVIKAPTPTPTPVKAPEPVSAPQVPPYDPNNPNGWKVGQVVTYQHGMLGKMDVTITKVTADRIFIHPHVDNVSDSSMTINQAAVRLIPKTEFDSKPDSSAITMFESPKFMNVKDIKRGAIVEVHTSKGVVQRTVARTGFDNSKTNWVVRWADNKKADGHKGALSYDPSAKVKVVGQDDSHKIKKVSSANAPSEVQKLPEPKLVKSATPEPKPEPPKVVKPAAEVHAEAEPKVVSKADSNLPVIGSEQTQWNGNTQIRQVKVLAHNPDGTVRVRALNGPMSGSEYDIHPEVFDKPPKVVSKGTDTPPVVKKAPDVVKTSPVGAAKVQIKVKIKASNIKIRSDKVEVGDVIDMGRARIPTGETKQSAKWYKDSVPVYKTMKLERKVLSVDPPDAGGYVKLHLSPPLNYELFSNPDAQEQDKGGYYKMWTGLDKSAGPVNKKVDTVVSVRRMQEVTGGGGKKVKLGEHPDAATMQSALSDALDSGEGIGNLNPEHRNLPAGQSVGHVQQLLYDMAVGSTNGVTDRTTAKTDADYTKELTDSGEAKKIVSDAIDKTGIHLESQYIPSIFRERAAGGFDLPSDISDEELVKYHLAMGMPGEHKSNFTTGRMPGEDGKYSFHDYVKSFDVHDADYTKGLTGKWGAVEKAAQSRAKLEQDRVDNGAKAVKERIRELRQVEGSGRQSFNLPTWNSVKMEGHNWNAINAEVAHQAQPHALTLTDDPLKTIASRNDTPSFHTAGLVDDGILYHHQQSKPLDYDKITSGINQILGQSGWPDPHTTNLRVREFISAIDTPSIEALRTKLNGPWAGAFNAKENDTNDKIAAYLDRVEKRTAGDGGTVTSGHVPNGTANNAMRKIMDGLGAISQSDSTRYASNGNWTSLRPGTELVHSEGARDMSPEDKFAQFKAVRQIMPAFNSQSAIGPDTIDARSQYASAATLDEAEAAVIKYQSTIDKSEKISPKSTKRINAFIKDAHKQIDNARNAKEINAGAKRIEYVPWQQDNSTTITPRSDRGRLTLHGYTPEEAAAKLKELGVVGDLESQIPANQIFRSPRRSGSVMPLLPAYVRGEAAPPTTERLLTHGLTAAGGMSAPKILEAIFRTGGLQSIAERHKRAIRASGASVVGDAASGIDHVVFQSLGGGGAVGSGAGVRMIMKPDVFMRRDVLLAPRDFGGGASRYARYKKYRDDLEVKAGGEVSKTDLWTPLDPAARQLHLDNVQDRPGSSEYNVAGSVHPNDIAVISVNDPAEAEQVKLMLKTLVDQGVIDEAPVVVDRSAFNAMSTGKEPLPQDGGDPNKLAMSDDVKATIASASGYGQQAKLKMAYEKIVSGDVTQSLIDSWKLQASNDGYGYGLQMQQVIAAALAMKQQATATKQPTTGPGSLSSVAAALPGMKINEAKVKVNA